MKEIAEIILIELGKETTKQLIRKLVKRAFQSLSKKEEKKGR